jgi:L-threonylcarbamoyladenylate synthase
VSAIAPTKLRAALRALAAGGVIAYPTEGVWGLGCDPQNEDAILRLLRLKRRDWRKGLILIACDFAQLEPYVERPSKTALKRAFETWPGPHTWVFPCAATVSPLLTGEYDSLAVRVTAHPVAAQLCAAFGGALVSTSANVSNRPPARSASEVRLAFGKRIDALVPGALGGLEKPTSIRHVVSGLILRR